MTATLNPPPAESGITHWSARALADQLTRQGTPVSFAEVARIWRDWGLHPHRCETFAGEYEDVEGPRHSAVPVPPGWILTRFRCAMEARTSSGVSGSPSASQSISSEISDATSSASGRV
ncbi:hypothetical protein AB0C01_14310 [Micromonospora sp. NPDC048905]|uniref:hypothetical protein n=1 Tax=Micromonospora sp. NPDC048905 TaxID=3155494 RepID=UPI0034097700